MQLNRDQMLEAIDGWAAVVEHFGQSPSFHDSEIIKIELLRNPQRAEITVHAWRTDPSKLDKDGCFFRDKSALIYITVYEICFMVLEDWNNQNVVDDMVFFKDGDVLGLHISSSYGLGGTISGKDISVSVAPLGSNHLSDEAI